MIPRENNLSHHVNLACRCPNTQPAHDSPARPIRHLGDSPAALSKIFPRDTRLRRLSRVVCNKRETVAESGRNGVTSKRTTHTLGINDAGVKQKDLRNIYCS